MPRVHRDLKPANIMLVPDAAQPTLERVKLLDFGIAKLDTATLNLENPLTRTGAFMGTPHYMSPEQCKGTRNVDDRSDVYALGVILFQMLTGRLPFIGEGDGSVMAMHIYEPVPKPRELVPTITEPMQDLILQMMSKDQQARPGMALVMKRLEEQGAADGLNSADLSVTFQDTSGEPFEAPEPATLMRQGGAASPAARTMMLSGGLNPSSLDGPDQQLLPSQSANQSSPSIPPATPSTLGPVTGQLGTITRYSRPVLAGVAGACGLIALVGIAVVLLQKPKPPTQQVQIRTARSNHPTTGGNPTGDGDTVTVTPPLTGEVKPTEPTPPVVTPETPGTKPVVQKPVPQQRPKPVASGKKGNKRKVVKKKGKAKATGKNSSKTTGVSVVD